MSRVLVRFFFIRFSFPLFALFICLMMNFPLAFHCTIANISTVTVINSLILLIARCHHFLLVLLSLSSRWLPRPSWVEKEKEKIVLNSTTPLALFFFSLSLLLSVAIDFLTVKLALCQFSNYTDVSFRSLIIAIDFVSRVAIHAAVDQMNCGESILSSHLLDDFSMRTVTSFYWIMFPLRPEWLQVFHCNMRLTQLISFTLRSKESAYSWYLCLKVYWPSH